MPFVTNNHDNDNKNDDDDDDDDGVSLLNAFLDPVGVVEN